ncbi:LysR family transcriptional regulator [Salipiger mangrovisoli]|uniref:LysR family transcriptional regulator n=1 Tax=Salipiger mangrovisoli TaxID=2865933 RepID=A0ABR9X0U9_9RHOB|nr:LysR family transcriptional regulator [Salipiger mangrovisoli]MBE9637180.1 LysR family transcriptional regulator [Salipiger mangrovisoli]
MRFRGLDLNLLVALEVLLDEGSVSAAARRLNLSQAATSNALARLRAHFGEDLLVRVGRQMVPTDRGRRLHGEVAAVLRQIEARVLVPGDFDPAAQDRQITIMAAEAVSLGLLAAVSRDLRRRAPKVTLVVRPLGDNPQARLDRGEIDLLAIPLQYAAGDHPRAPLYDEAFSVICWREAEIAARPLTPEAYVAADHVLLQLGPDRKTPIDRILIEQLHGQLSGSVTVSGHAAVPWHVLATERLGTLPERTAQQFAEVLPLAVRPLPFDIPANRLVLQWGRHADGDAGLHWLRELMRDLA